MKFYQFLLNYYTELHQRVNLFNPMISSLLLIYYYIQFVGIVVQPTHYDTKDMNTMMNILNIFSSVSQLGRPYQFLMQYQGFRLYSFLFPAFVAVFFKIDLILQLYQHFQGNKKNEHSALYEQKYYLKNFRNTLSFLLQIYDYAFNLIFLDLCSLPFKEIQNQSQLNIGLLIIVCICFIFQISFALFNLQCEETLQFPCLPLKLESFSLRHMIALFLITLNLILNNITFNQQRIVSEIINCLIVSIYVKNEISRMSTIYNFAAILLLCSSFSYSLTNIFFLSQQDKSYQIMIVIMLCPLLANILFQKKEKIRKIQIQKNRTIEDIYKNLTILFECKRIKTNPFELLTLKSLSSAVNNQEMFQKELSLMNNKIINMGRSNKVYWYKKYIIIKQSEMKYAETLSLIENLFNQYLFVDYNKQFVKIYLEISYLQNQQLKYLNKEAQNMLHSNLSKHDTEDILIISSYISQKSQGNIVLQQIKELFEEKYSVYQQLLDNKKSHQVDIYKSVYDLTSKGLKLQQILKNQFEQQKSLKFQQLLTLLYIEFCNNIIQAELLKYYQIFSEPRSCALEIMDYLIIYINNDMKNLTICQQSTNFVEALGYKTQSSQFDFNSLLPPGFLDTHQQLVFRYLTMDEYTLKNMRALFIRGSQNYFYEFNIEIHISPSINTGIQFYVFTSPVDTQPSVLLVNSSYSVIGYTKPLVALFQRLNIYSQSSLYLQNINLIFNNFSPLEVEGGKTSINLIARSTNQIIQSTIKMSKSIFYLNFSECEENFILSQEVQKVQAPSVNNESIVIVPNELFIDNLNSPLSLDQKGLKLGKSETVIEKQFLTERSKESQRSSSPQRIINLNINRDEEDNQNDKFDNDKASSKYTRGFLDNSMFYQKYNRMNNFLYSQKSIPHYKIGIIFLIFGILYNIIYQFINIFDNLPKFQRANVDADILAIKSYFMTPIHNCVTAQVCVVDYIIQFGLTKEISQELAYHKLAFGLDSVNQSYYQLKGSLTAALNNNNLEDLFTYSMISMQQIDNLSLPIRNISLKTALYQYFEAQYYISNINYYDVLNFKPTNDFVYYMSNIITIDNYFDELNQQSEDFVMNRIELMKQELTIIILKFGVLEFLCLSLALSLILKHQHISITFFKLLSHVNVFALQKELQKLQKMIIILSSEKSFKEYQYELYEREKQIKSFLAPYNLKINQRRLSNQDQTPKKNKFFLIYIGLSLFLILPQIIINSVNNNFCFKYQNSSKLLTQVSLISSAITAVYEIREINYMISAGLPFFYFFTDKKRLEQNVKLVQELNKINLFSQTFPEIDENQLLVTAQFSSIYNNMKTENLCDFLINFSKTLGQEHCDLIYSGVMKLGLFNTLTEIYRQILSEYQNTNGFEVQLRNKTAAFEEAEIGLIASDAMLYIQRELFSGILSQTNIIVTVHQITSIIFLIVDVILILFIILKVQPYFHNQYQVMKNTIQIVPIYQFYLDQQFEIEFRTFAQKNQ